MDQKEFDRINRRIGQALGIKPGDKVTIDPVSGNLVPSGGQGNGTFVQVAGGGGGGTAAWYDPGPTSPEASRLDEKIHLIQAKRRAAIEVAVEAARIDGKRGVLVQEGLAYFKVGLSDRVPYGQMVRIDLTGSRRVDYDPGLAEYFAQLAAEQERPERIEWRNF